MIGKVDWHHCLFTLSNRYLQVAASMWSTKPTWTSNYSDYMQMINRSQLTFAVVVSSNVATIQLG